MNQQLAKTILGIAPDETDASVFRDALDDKVFEHATYFLNRAFLPKLAAVRIKRLEELIAAEDVLIGTPLSGISQKEKENTFSENPADLQNLIRSYNRQEAIIKQSLARADAASAVIETYEDWIRLFNAHALKFAEMYPNQPFAKEADSGVKISSQVNMMEMLEELNGDSIEKPLVHQEFSRLKKLSN